MVGWPRTWRLSCRGGVCYRIPGISSILASVAQICGRNGHNNQCLTSKFPMQRNRELIGPYQGIKSAYQGNFLPDQGRVPWSGFSARFPGQVLATSVTCTRCSLGELRQRWKPFSHAEINRLDPLPDARCRGRHRRSRRSWHRGSIESHRPPSPFFLKIW